jgi:oxygen-dependent protoporphyrinogen oxidase
MNAEHRIKRVAVVGAGISGLSAAYRLRELAAAREYPLEVTVLERDTRVGGPLETIRRDGFVIETGADSFLSEKPWAADLARRLGIGDQLIATRDVYRKTFVVRRGRLLEIPAGFSLLAPTHLGAVFTSRLFSPLGKLRIAFEPFVRTRVADTDESLESFVTRRLGREVFDRVAQPLAGGIYTADPARLSVAATMPRFIEMERRYGSLIKGLQAAEEARSIRAAEHSESELAESELAESEPVSGARWSLFQSFKNGIATLPEALAARLGDSIRKSAQVVAISRIGAHLRLTFARGGALDADAAIIAVPAYAAAQMIAPVSRNAASLMSQIHYASAATVNLTYRESDFQRPPTAFGFVVPSIERRKIIAASFSSFKFEGRAPEGSILARAFVGGSLQPSMMQLDDEKIVASVRDEFRQLLGINAEPGTADVRRWADSMPQYEVGHLARVAEIERIVGEIPAVAIAGAAYRGVGIPDCVRSGEQAADSIFAQLTAEI